MTQQRRPSAPASRNLPTVLPRPTRPRWRLWSSSTTLARGHLRRRPPFRRRDPRLSPFDPRQPLLWCAFSRRLVKRFRPNTRSAYPVHDYNGDLVVGDWFHFLGVALGFPSTRSRDSPFGTWRVVFLRCLFGWVLSPFCNSPPDYVINYWIFGKSSSMS